MLRETLIVDETWHKTKVLLKYIAISNHNNHKQPHYSFPIQLSKDAQNNAKTFM